MELGEDSGVKLFQLNPSIRETNKYLSETVEALTAKHGGVSSEDFEKELVSITGIGWKQVKNYKNHPKPGERLKDNALVLKFIRQKQNQDTGRKIRRFLAYTAPLVVLVFSVYWYVSKPREIEQFVVHQVPPSAHATEAKETRIFLKLSSKGWLFRLGPTSQSDIPLDKFSCLDLQGMTMKNCSYNEASGVDGLQVAIILDGGVIRRYTIIAFNSEDVQSLMGQLSKLLGDKIKKFPAEDKQMDDITVDLENESVRLMGSHPNQKSMRTYLSVVVSLK